MRIHRPTISPPATRRGFTAAELTIGMIVAAFVAAAGAALTLAVSQGWTHAERTSMSQVRISRTCQTLEQIVRNAKLIGRYRAGTLEDPTATPAAVLVWCGDTDSRPPDDQVQFDEIAVVQYDGTNHRLVLYKADFATEAAAGPTANPTITDIASLSAADAIEVFKDSVYVKPFPLMDEAEVTGACFNVVAANNRGSRPSFEFTLQFSAAGQTTMQYGTATLRSPMP